MEDVDFRERLLAAQARVVFARAAAVYHPWRSIAEREVTKQIISHAIYAEKHKPFADQWRFIHLLRAMRGRARLYSSGRPSTIPLQKYRVVAYDILAPVIAYAVIRLRPLRRVVHQRYRNA
jgi:GT2 family glycosyltransferase